MQNHVTYYGGNHIHNDSTGTAIGGTVMAFVNLDNLQAKLGSPNVEIYLKDLSPFVGEKYFCEFLKMKPAIFKKIGGDYTEQRLLEIWPILLKPKSRG